MLPRFILFAAALSLALVPVAGSAQPAPCSSDDHRAFDFWAGSWDVTTPDGRLAGHNEIRVLMNGCVLHEHYTTDRGYEGESLNIYDVTRGVWHQTWVDVGGTLLLLEGGRDGDAMVMVGETVDRDGTVTLNRITWSPTGTDPDRVRQHWQQSTDGGESWSTAFDGTYTRVAGAGDRAR